MYPACPLLLLLQAESNVSELEVRKSVLEQEAQDLKQKLQSASTQVTRIQVRHADCGESLNAC